MIKVSSLPFGGGGFLLFFRVNSTASSFQGNLGHLTWVRHSSRKNIRVSVCSFCCLFGVHIMDTNTFRLPVVQIFNMLTDVDAYNCTWGLYKHHERVCTESWLWEKNYLLHWGLKPTSVLHLAFQSEYPNPLSYPASLWQVKRIK